MIYLFFFISLEKQGKMQMKLSHQTTEKSISIPEKGNHNSFHLFFL